jgi:succinoglycan biosynthesis protein ExoO
MGVRMRRPFSEPTVPAKSFNAHLLGTVPGQSASRFSCAITVTEINSQTASPTQGSLRFNPQYLLFAVSAVCPPLTTELSLGAAEFNQMSSPFPLELREEPNCWILAPAASGRSPAATVIIPTYNAATTITRAISSALSQTIEDIEIIVIDDDSTDASWSAINLCQLADETGRICLIRNKKNIGKSAAMNYGASIARGRWIAVLDADDWYDPNRLRYLITIAEQANADMVADNQVLFDQGAKVATGTGWRFKEPPSREWRDAHWELTMDNFLAGSHVYDNFNFGMLKPVVRAEFIRDTGLSYEEEARFGEDFLYLLAFFLLRGKARVCNYPLYFYTQPYGAISRQWSRASRSRYDFMQSIAFTQKYLTESRDMLTPTQAKALESRCKQLLSIENFFAAREKLRAHPLQGLAGLVGSWSALDFTFRRLVSRALPGWQKSMASKTARRSNANH